VYECIAKGLMVDMPETTTWKYKLKSTINYSVSDPEPGYPVSANSSKDIIFNEKEMVSQYVLPAQFYIAMELSTQSPAFGLDLASSLPLEKSDVAFYNYNKVIKTVTMYFSWLLSL
jgi:hypothetical protein